MCVFILYVGSYVSHPDKAESAVVVAVCCRWHDVIINIVVGARCRCSFSVLLILLLLLLCIYEMHSTHNQQLYNVSIQNRRVIVAKPFHSFWMYEYIIHRNYVCIRSCVYDCS